LENLIDNLRLSFALNAVCDLGVPDRVKQATLLSDLSSSIGANEDFLRRLILFCSKNGYFSFINDTITLNEEAKKLLKGSSFSKQLSFYTHPTVASSFASLSDAVINGKSGFECAHEKPLFSFLGDDPEFGEVFNGAMEGDGQSRSKAIREKVNFDSFDRVVDVGGGTGEILVEICNSSPSAKGILFELPAVIRAVETFYSETKTDLPIELVGGDFFEDDLPQGDCLILNNILHDWGDADAIKIIQKCREAMTSRSSRLMIVENLLDDQEVLGVHQLDLTMMVMTVDGRERTLSEYEKLLKGQFTLVKTRRLPDSNYVLECRPITGGR
jgi:hypothetical protein